MEPSAQTVSIHSHTTVICPVWQASVPSQETGKRWKRSTWTGAWTLETDHVAGCSPFTVANCWSYNGMKLELFKSGLSVISVRQFEQGRPAFLAKETSPKLTIIFHNPWSTMGKPFTSPCENFRVPLTNTVVLPVTNTCCCAATLWSGAGGILKDGVVGIPQLLVEFSPAVLHEQLSSP